HTLASRLPDPPSTLSLHTCLGPASPLSFPTRRSSDLLPAALRLHFASDSVTGRAPAIVARTRSDRKMMRSLFIIFLSLLVLATIDRKSTRLNSSHVKISYAVFCLKKKNTRKTTKN